METLSGKNLSQKRAGGVAQGIGPEFKPKYHKKKKKISGLEQFSGLMKSLLLVLKTCNNQSQWTGLCFRLSALQSFS
jgi:hypothetical protein